MCHNFACGSRRALWISINEDLMTDAQRDLDDVWNHARGGEKVQLFRFAHIPRPVCLSELFLSIPSPCW